MAENSENMMVDIIMVKNRKDTLLKLLCLEMLLQCSFSFGLKELINVKKVQLCRSFFSLKMPELWLGRTMLTGEKRGWPNSYH